MFPAFYHLRIAQDHQKTETLKRLGGGRRGAEEFFRKRVLIRLRSSIFYHRISCSSKKCSEVGLCIGAIATVFTHINNEVTTLFYETSNILPGPLESEHCRRHMSKSRNTITTRLCLGERCKPGSVSPFKGGNHASRQRLLRLVQICLCFLAIISSCHGRKLQQCTLRRFPVPRCRLLHEISSPEFFSCSSSTKQR